VVLRVSSVALCVTYFNCSDVTPPEKFVLLSKNRSVKHLLIILLFIVPVFLPAQRFNGGIIAGGLVSQVDGDDNGGFHKFGYLAGGLVSLRVSRHCSFQMELEYIQKGARGTDTVNIHDFLMRFHYLEVPLLFQLTFAKRFSLEAGPAMDVLLGSYEERDGLEVPSIYAEPMRNVTLSGIFGVSGYITNHLKVNFRFNYSLLSIREPTETPPADYRYILWQKGQFNNVLSLSLLWYFKPNEDL
jgi:hypothetical protein